jgi:hypothetical protein
MADPRPAPLQPVAIFSEARRVRYRMAGVLEARNLQLHPASRVPDPTRYAES